MNTPKFLYKLDVGKGNKWCCKELAFWFHIWSRIIDIAVSWREVGSREWGSANNS